MKYAAKWKCALQDAAVVIGSGAAYFVVAVFSLRFFATHQTPAAIWLATGVLVALVLILPKRLWPGILTAAFLAGTAGNYLTGKPLGLALGLGFIDAIEGLLSGILLTAVLSRRITLTRLRELTGLVFLSAVIANGIAALGGAAFFWLLVGSPFWDSWRIWWLSNGIGILTVTPFIVSWWYGRGWCDDLKSSKILESVVLLVVLIGSSVAIFGGSSWSSLALPYLVFPFLIWAALRFGVQGASSAAVALAAVAVWYTTNGSGPFAIISASGVEKLLQVQSFITAALVCSLIPATVIAERRDAEERLRRSESRLGLAQEIAGVGSFILDPVGPGYRWSEQMFRMMGRHVSVGVPNYEELLTSVHPDDRALVQQSHERLFREQQPFEIDFRYICPDGSCRYLHAIARAEVDQHSHNVSAFGTVMDLTDRKAIEEQLRQAQKMEAVGRLAGGVAHDFNNLLGVIIGYSELARAELKENDPLISKIEPISKAAVRAASLTSQLLAFSRRQVLKPEPLDLNRVVTDLEKMLRRLIGEEIEITTRLQPKLPFVKADPGQIDQVILNLAVNSKDAMSSGGKLTIATSSLHQQTAPVGFSGHITPGEYVKLTVSDTGQGMDTATKSHIFEPFFTTKAKGKGTGLGLATVYGIVNQSNGYIWAESEVGKGTDFHILLPVIQADAEVTQVSAAPVVVQERKETLLLVEDEQPLRELIKRVIQGMGCKVIEALSGDHALQIVGERNDIDVLLTDVVMPKMDGFELARRITERSPRIKVLYMSGYSDEMVTRHHQGAQQPNFLQKPFRPDELRNKLRELMDGTVARSPVSNA